MSTLRNVVIFPVAFTFFLVMLGHTKQGRICWHADGLRWGVQIVLNGLIKSIRLCRSTLLQGIVENACKQFR